MYKFNLTTPKEGLYNITKEVKEAVYDSGVRDGLCVVYCPHTTAGITINENADDHVCTDIMFGLNKSFPNCEEFLHDEGNSSGHVKSSVVGVSQTLLIDRGELVLGVWQNIFFAEFDPPRNRNFYVKII
jgi:secondary thiamine-phosphate synthase enzyme